MAERKKKTTATKLKKSDAPAAAMKYEAMFLFPPPGVVDVDGMVKNAQGIIERHGGKILVIKKWDERKLAYEVNGQKRGTYIIAFFTATGEAVGPIERDVKLNEQVLRVMVTKADHLNEDEMNAVEPQPIVREERPSWERDDRGGFRGGDRGPRGDDRGPREDRPRDDRPREDRPPPRRRDEAPAAEAGAGKE